VCSNPLKRSASQLQHVAALSHACEAKALVEPVGIQGAEQPALNIAHCWMLQHELDQTAPDTAAAMHFIDEYVAQIGKAREIADDACKADLLLPLSMVDAKG